MSQNKLIASNFEYHKEGLTRTREHKKKKVPLPKKKTKKKKVINYKFFCCLSLEESIKCFLPISNTSHPQSPQQ
jgi:hypothetical protein